MTAVLLPNGKQQYFTTAGLPAVGYKVATFAAGTSTPQVTWQDALKVAQNANPIILDGRGEASIFWDGAYKVQLQDSTGAVIWTEDNLQSQPNGFSLTLVPAVTNTIDIGSNTLSWRNVYVGANNAPVLDTVTGNIGYFARTAAEIASAITPASFVFGPGLSGRNGVDPTGTADSTAFLQTWAKEAFAMFGFTDAQGLWNGGGAAAPIINLAPGKYKVSGATVLPTGCTVTGNAHPANTTSHTRLIMNSTPGVDNRNNPIFKFSRATVLGGGVSANAYLNMTIQNLEFWYVTGSNNFNNPLSGAGITFGAYPLGGSLFFDVDVVDTRIVSCCFQNSPCCIRIKDVSGATTRGDGLPAASTPAVNLFIEECEFDAAAAHVWATNSVLDLTFRNCAFFGGRHVYAGCTGRVVYENCRFYGGSYIDASDTGNNFSLFRVSGCDFDQNLVTADMVSIYKSNVLDLKNLTFFNATAFSTIVANFCSSGSILGNSINDSGFNGSAATGLAAIAAIKMVDCLSLLVSNNNIFATDAASYNGFGILTLSSARTSQKNFINGNVISAPYNGATFNGQTRRLNLASSADIAGVNYDPNGFTVPKQAAVAGTFQSVTYSAAMTVDASAGNEFDITATNGTAFTINAPTNPSPGQIITYMIRNTSGGALGVATWNAVFKLAAWVQPNNGASLSIVYRYDGTNWVELYRGANNIPN